MSKIYQPQGRAREYSPLALNFFSGCTHGCVYCYVPKMMSRFRRGYEHSECSPSVNFAELEKSAKKYEGCNQQVLLSFTGDPYCGVSPDTTTEVLRILLKYGHKVAILTKGGYRCLRDLDLFKRFGDRIKVGATLTCDNDKDTREWEAGAAMPGERLEALRILSSQGVKTWVSFEPVIFPQQSLALLRSVSPFVDHVKIGKMNYMPGCDSVDWSSFLSAAVQVCRESGLKFYIKKELQRFKKEVVFNPDEINQDLLNL